MTSPNAPEDFEIKAATQVLASSPTTVVAFLPVAIAPNGEPEYAATTVSVAKILKAGGIPTSDFLKEGQSFREQRGLDWFGPTLVFSAALLASNGALVSLTINLISSYLYDILAGRDKDATAHLRVLTQRPDGSYHVTDYKGPVSGLADLPDVISSAGRGDGETNEGAP